MNLINKSIEVLLIEVISRKHTSKFIIKILYNKKKYNFNYHERKYIHLLINYSDRLKNKK